MLEKHFRRLSRLTAGHATRNILRRSCDLLRQRRFIQVKICGSQSARQMEINTSSVGSKVRK